MIVTSVKVLIATDDCFSLKEKRKVIKSIKDRLKNKFNFSVAEVDYQDVYHQSLLGMAFVSNDAQFSNSVIDKSINFLEEYFPGRLVDYDFDSEYK